MSPRDALKRMTLTFAQPQRAEPKEGAVRHKEASSRYYDAQSRLAAIMAEVSATPIEDFFPQTRTRQQKNPASALRWFVVTDALAFVVSFAVAWILASLTNEFLLDRGFPFVGSVEATRLAQYCVVALGALVWFWHTGHYRQRMPFWMETQKILGAMGLAMVVDGFLQFASKQDFSRLWLMSGWLFAGLTIISLRFMARRFMRRNGTWSVRTLLVGSGVMADDARAALRSEPGLGYDVVMQIENLPLLLQQVDQSWERLCARFDADYVVIALDGVALAAADEAIAQLSRSGVPFSVSPPLRHLPVLGMAPQYFFNHDVMMLTPVNNLEQPLPRFIKRTLDVIGSGLALIVASPVFLVLTFLVRKDGGTAFFGHGRIGLNGKPFKCLKFRSMVLDADEALDNLLRKDEEARKEWALTQKLRNDPRVTRIGDLMRRWSLDELPQLINVFKGEMSLVGPRPIVFAETLRYREDITHYYRVRPGLTGLWQVSGRSDVTFTRRVQMDSWYVRNWSLWHDIAIICKTFPVVLRKTGAY
ncbi:MAG TPA: UDP-phosphate galactose phosphotransferase [Rhodospirillaceae bacterium]|nr:UDP-phosphate galactose phosphotransferase [Rhodospirillaceae bacterium]